MTKQATDQYHWDFERLMDRTNLVLSSWEGAAHIEPERLEMAQQAFGQAFTILRMCIEDA
jgi:hypothetical protein